MSLRFPIKFRTWESAKTAIAFPAVADGKDVTCRVTGDALVAKCGALAAKPEPAYRAFDAHRAVIESLASRRYASRKREKDGSILIRTADFPD